MTTNTAFEAAHPRADRNDPRANGAFTTKARPGGAVAGLDEVAEPATEPTLLSQGGRHYYGAEEARVAVAAAFECKESEVDDVALALALERAHVSVEDESAALWSQVREEALEAYNEHLSDDGGEIEDLEEGDPVLVDRLLAEAYGERGEEYAARRARLDAEIGHHYDVATAVADGYVPSLEPGESIVVGADSGIDLQGYTSLTITGRPDGLVDVVGTAKIDVEAWDDALSDSLGRTVSPATTRAILSGYLDDTPIRGDLLTFEMSPGQPGWTLHETAEEGSEDLAGVVGVHEATLAKILDRAESTIEENERSAHEDRLERDAYTDRHGG